MQDALFIGKECVDKHRQGNAVWQFVRQELDTLSYCVIIIVMYLGFAISRVRM